MLQRFTLPLRCPHCGQTGEVVWTESAGGNRNRGSARALVSISEGFHAEVGRLGIDKDNPIVVCNVCDEIQPD
jgi:hypothetical protein